MRGLLLCLLMLGSAQADTRFVEEVKKLASTGLPYIYGADDPSRGGLDCSGFIRVAAKNAWGITLPDEACLQLEFARQHGKVWDKTSRDWSPQVLKPGDLVFWTGTHPSRRPSPVTHVMVYLGNNEIAGSQSAGHRLDTGGHGVGFYPFRLRNPIGDPSVLDDSFYRHSMILYAYARLDPEVRSETAPYQTVSLH